MTDSHNRRAEQQALLPQEAFRLILNEISNCLEHHDISKFDALESIHRIAKEQYQALSRAATTQAGGNTKFLDSLADEMQRQHDAGRAPWLNQYDIDAVRLASQPVATTQAYAQTPMKETSYGGKEPAFRMDAYYYSFAATGYLAIDLILSAVACAGKAYHHTEDWGEKCKPYHDKLRGETPIDWIQNAAEDAATILDTPSQPVAPVPEKSITFAEEIELAGARGICNSTVVAPVAPDGFVLVPRKATPEMLFAGERAHYGYERGDSTGQTSALAYFDQSIRPNRTTPDYGFDFAWSAMLAAAPHPAQPQPSSEQNACPYVVTSPEGTSYCRLNGPPTQEQEPTAADWQAYRGQAILEVYNARGFVNPDDKDWIENRAREIARERKA